MPERVDEPGMGVLEVFPLDTSEDFLFGLCKDIFEHYWSSIHFGILIQGAVWEIRAPNAPTRISLYDGYLTADFGAWHFHVCIGQHKGSRNNPATPELAAWRRTSRAELYRHLDDANAPVGWGLRLFNGKDEQQLTVFLPNPFLSDELKPLPEPDWTRLNLWNHLRQSCLGLEQDPKDRSAKRFSHA